MKLRRLKRSRLFQRAAARTLAWILRALGATWRVERTGRDPFSGAGRPFAGALWHRNLLMAAVLFRSPGVAVPVSRSRDGDLTAEVLVRMGFAPSPRGSSSRGGVGLLRAMIRAVGEGLVVGVLPDGPRGPARRAKPGVVALARATGRPIYPVGMSARPCIRFGSWDRALLPLPFARVAVAYGEPIHVPKSSKDEELEAARRALEQALERLTETLDARME